MKSTELKGKRVLVTGASGFVGRHLTFELLNRGAEVIALDNQNEVPIDIRDWQLLHEFGKKLIPLDLVYHLAALMFVPYSFENPRELYEVNVLGTINILELCRLHDVERFIFASSYVYGPPQYLPVDEEHPLNPTSPYARSKVIGEDLCRAYHEDYGLKCTILRPFNIYGEGQSGNFLMPSILKQLESGEVRLNDPKPKRDFLYIMDTTEAYIKAGIYDKSGFQVINIGSGISYSVKEIVGKISEAWGKEVKVNYQHRRRKGEILNVVADIGKAKRELGWEPRIKLDEGLSKYIKWYKKSCI